MTITLADITPLNFLEEKAKCLADPDYNPQFRYPKKIESSLLTEWGLPQENYILLAKNILKKYKDLGLRDHVPDSTIDQTFVQNFVTEYLDQKNVKGYHISFTSNQMARCMVAGREISFKLPLKLSEEEFKGLFRHEVETHVLRRWNHECNFTFDYTDKDHRRTEEGLAGVHTYLFRPIPLFAKSSMRYLATAMSLSKSFVEVRSYVESFGINTQKAMLIAMRAKRGIEDLSQPGANTRDLVYLEGVVNVCHWLLEKNHDARQLYIGRLTIEEAETYDWRRYESLVLPDFLQDMTKYTQEVRRISSFNGFDTVSKTYATP